MPRERKKLYRSRKDRIIAGVCGGLGEYFSVDPVIVRILFVLLAFANGFGILLYVILLIVVPVEPGPEIEINREEKIREFAEKTGEKIESLAQEVSGQFKAEAGKPARDLAPAMGKRNTIGIIIVVIGLIFLLDQFFPVLNFFSWRYVWPLGIILLGIFIILRDKN